MVMLRWRRHRTKSGNRTIFVPDYFESKDDHDRNSSSYLPVATWIGSLSQVAMLVVVLFGYIYTVRPVFQNQLLQEKLATAELERLEVEEQIQFLEAERDRTEDSLHDVQRKITSLESQQLAVEDELEVARGKARRAQTRASRLEDVVQRQVNELEVARWELLMIDFTFARMFSDMNYLTRDWDDRPDFPEYLHRYRVEWPDPFSVLLSSIAALRKRNASEPRYPESYINEFGEFIEARKDELTCEEPPFEDLEKSFRQRSSRVEAMVDEKTEEYIDNLISEYQERGERVRITDEFRERTSRMYRLTEEINLERELKDKVREYVDNCRLVAQSVVEEFRNLKGITR